MNTGGAQHHIEISEIYRAAQGEGPSMGRPAVFLRTRRCNLSCRWCDTKYTWDKGDAGYQQFWDIPAKLLWRQLLRFPEKFLVWTGGEPLLWQRQMEPVCTVLHNYHWRIEIETNGTIEPGEKLLRSCYFNVSPKLAGAGVQRGYTLDMLRFWGKQRRAILKFVIASAMDLEELDRLVESVPLSRRQVWVMPEGTGKLRQLQQMAWLLPQARQRGYNFTTRLHILAYGQKRGT